MQPLMDVKNGGIKESSQNNEKKKLTVYYMIQVKCPSPYPTGDVPTILMSLLGISDNYERIDSFCIYSPVLLPNIGDGKLKIKFKITGDENRALDSCLSLNH